MDRFQEALPPASLARFVHALWDFDAGDDPPATHHVPPDGCVSIVLATTPAGVRPLVTGPRLGDLAVPLVARARYRGVRMRPEAAGSLLGIVPREWVGRVAPLADADPELAHASAAVDVDASAALLIADLERRAESVAPPDPIVRDALELIEAGDGRVDSLAVRLGTSPRTLQRRFLRATGLTPKSFVRIRRFRQAIARILESPAPDWGRVAADHGFADQAHLAREVAALAGASPSTLGRRLGRIDHVDVRP